MGSREQNYKRLRELGDRKAMWTEKNRDLQLTDAVNPWQPHREEAGEINALTVLFFLYLVSYRGSLVALLN